MNIILFTHPAFLGSQSMPRFANMLKQAYEQRGHQVAMWSPQACVYNLVPAGSFKKWAGYIDQYVLFPRWVKQQLKTTPKETLFVFCDQALGPWVPLVKNLPHVVHAHDLLALRSALGEVPENPTGWTGRIYQRYIRSGFQQAKNFISISNRTKQDLQQFGSVRPVISEVVYNGLNYPYTSMAQNDAIRVLQQAGLPADAKGMLLHVGGNQWYKNLAGIIRLYAAYVAAVDDPLPLWCISPPPGDAVKQLIAQVPSKGKVLFYQGLDNQALQAAYSVAKLFLFPSLAEGFGWPLIEAQACGCPVVTTDDAPMNEVAGPVATYLPLLKQGDDVAQWAQEGAEAVKKLLAQNDFERKHQAEQAMAWAARFTQDNAIEGYLKVYERIIGNDV